MARQELGRRMNDDVGPPVEGAQQVGGRQRVVDDERDARRMGDFGDRFQIDDEAARIGEGFEEETLGVGMLG